MSSTERFVALLAGIIAIIGGIGAMLRYLVKISWDMGQLVQRFGDHVTDSGRTHTDQEARIRNLERGGRRRG
jgi:hypothetical protein